MCYYRTDDGKCRKFTDDKYTSYCVDGPCPDDTPTNADRIRGMSDEELADSRVGEFKGFLPFPAWIAIDVPDKIVLSKDEAIKIELDWLRQPAKEEDYEVN